MLERALDAGLNLLDTGNTYAMGEGERIIGRALTANGRRDQTLIATKVHFSTGPNSNDQGNSRHHIIQACEDSLRRLQTDYIDLYQIHRHSPTIPVDETLSAMTDLVHQGKVRYVGCSTHPARKVMEAIMVSELKGYVRYIAEQPPYNLLDRRIENEVIPMCQAHGLGIITWSPLAMGILAGRYASATELPPDSRAILRGKFYTERVSPPAVEVGHRFVRLAQEFNLSPAQLAVLWVKDQPGITAPLIGPRTMKQLEHLLPVLDMQLDDSVWAACDELVPPGSAVSNFLNTTYGVGSTFLQEKEKFQELEHTRDYAIG